MSLRVLRDRRAALVAEAGGMLALAETENRAFTASESARENAIDAEITEIEGQIAGAERQADRMRNLNLSGGAAAGGANMGALNVLQGGSAGAASAPKSGFNSLGEMLMAVRRADDRRLQDTRVDSRLNFAPFAGPTGQSEGVSSDGGYLVGTDLIGDLMTNMWNTGEISSRINKIQVGASSNGVKMNAVDETSRATGSRWGGFRTFWTAEAGLKLASTFKLRQMEMNLQKLTALFYATDELLEDAVGLQSIIEQGFPDEMGFVVEDAIMNGNGAGQPLGYLNSGAAVIVPATASQPAATINAANIFAMYARMPPANRKNAVWLVNAEAETQLYQLYIPIKNVAGTENVGGFAQANISYVPPGLQGNTYGLLMGRQVVVVEQAAPLGTPGDIQFVDLSAYLGIEKGGIQQASSIHVRFIYDETTFRFVYRFNGQPMWKQPITPYRGVNAISPFVLLAQR